MVMKNVGYIDLPEHRGAGGFDHGDIHSPSDRIYVAHTANDALDVIDFPQIASAMGVVAEPRKTPLEIVEPQPSTRAMTARAVAPFTLSATDHVGHMRKLEEIEAELIRMAITRYKGRMSEVARRLGIGRSTLYRKLKELGLDANAEDAAETAENAEDELKRASA